MERHTYASSGVDIQLAESFVKRLKKLSWRSAHSSLWPGAGGYASVYPVSPQEAIALTVDGVGTKLLLACQLNRHDTIGIDLVAMCANDLICVGAKPEAFLDYYAVGKLENNQADAIVSGIIAGCDQAGMILIGGETAEMPDLYQQGHYDMAGFAMGRVLKDKLITGQLIKPGQKIIGVASSGIHANGLSLARKVLAHNNAYAEQMLMPTLIYVQPVNNLLATNNSGISGISHITGGGWRNMLRLSENVGFHIDNPLPVLSIFQELTKHIAADEMYKTFNMGMGLAIIVEKNTAEVLEAFNSFGFTAQEIGYVTDKKKQITLSNSTIVLKDRSI